MFCVGELCFKYSAMAKLISVLNLQVTKLPFSFQCNMMPTIQYNNLPNDIWSYKTSLSLPLFIEVSVQSQESEFYVCVRVSILNFRRFFIYMRSLYWIFHLHSIFILDFHLHSIFILDVKAFTTQWYFCFSLYLTFLDFFPLDNFAKNNKLCYHLI